MVRLIFNATVRAEGPGLHGFYRVVAVPPGASFVWLAFVLPRTAQDRATPDEPVTAPGTVTRACRELLRCMEESGNLTEVTLEDPGTPARAEQMKAPRKLQWDTRCAALGRLLDHDAICESLQKSGRLGPLVRTVSMSSGLHRATVYRMWIQLCQRGFTNFGLVPQYFRCGAPGVARPVNERRRKAGRKPNKVRRGEVESFPQPGVTADDRDKLLRGYLRYVKPGTTEASIYRQVIEAEYVTQYDMTDKGLVAVLRRGTYPTLSQFRNLVDFETKAYERSRLLTTAGHFNRNMRGLRGHAHDNVAGPGYVYAIDSTIGDIYLRSSIDPTWIVGRPIVYIVVDVWSTAIVGFYLCLEGPSWRTAKLALFSTFGDPVLVASLWGSAHGLMLDPIPGVPAMLLCDRGEYLSMGARTDSVTIGMNTAFNPPYRPDQKGPVEVLHRIAKDEQIRSFLPGAIDARLREYDRRTDPRDSALTLRDFAAYLYRAFARYNLHSDRRYRLNADMIAAGVHPSPAGLWRFGHQACVGYQKFVPSEQLAATLLYRTTMAVRRNGNYVESLEYEGELATRQQWSLQARSGQQINRPAYIFPGSASRVWVPDEEGMCEFQLRSNARALPDTTLEEWRDAKAYEARDVADLDHQRLLADMERAALDDAMVKKAVAKVKAAEQGRHGPRPPVAQARALERTHGATASASESASPAPLEDDEHVKRAKEAYQDTMDRFFARMNQRGEDE
nr:hypothetical protein [uncultured Caldimonas sp.]